MKKICSKCGEEKEVCHFFTDRQKKDGLCSSCKNCHLKHQRENCESIRSYQRAWTNKNRKHVNKLARNRYVKKGASRMFDDKNPMWKGENVGMIALHNWIRRRKPKPKFCEECKKVEPIDLANISGEYKRDVNDFEWLCRKCHMTKDNRLLNLKQNKCVTKLSATAVGNS